MSLVMFWHGIKSPVWIIASAEDVCPLKSRKAVILFGWSEEIWWWVMTALVSEAVWLITRFFAVVFFLGGEVVVCLFLCFFCTWIQEQLFFTSECRRTCLAVGNKRVQDPSEEWRARWNEIVMLQKFAAPRLHADRLRCPLWFCSSSTALSSSMKGIWKNVEKQEDVQKMPLWSSRSFSFGGPTTGRSSRQKQMASRRERGKRWWRWKKVLGNIELLAERAERSRLEGLRWP